MKEAQAKATQIIANIQNVIFGKEEQIKLVLSCWLAGGHILLEDFPGTGKTILARSIAKSISVKFQRIQFTPDLLPSDVVGTQIYKQDTGTFQFLPGPIHTTVLLADEINRATPRTQSALLEAMAEKQVTVDGRTLRLNDLFFVIATQNPVEQQGTFPLPEAQLDRFLMKISIGYPNSAAELRMLHSQVIKHPIDSLQSVSDEKDLLQMRLAVQETKVSEALNQYALQIVLQTRSSNDLKLGGSPRATMALINCAKAYAFLSGSTFVKPEHIFKLAPMVLGHRVLLKTDSILEGKTPEGIIAEILKKVRVPVGA